MKHSPTSLTSFVLLTMLMSGSIASPALGRQSTTPTPPAAPAAAASPASPAAAAAVDPDLLLHIGVTAGRVRNGMFVDKTGKAKGTIVGNPMKTTLGPGEGYRFNGATDWLTIGDGTPAGRAWLPTREFTVQAWVSLRTTTQYGSIIGLMEDTGDAEQGWSLGYTNDAFTFSLATKGADDGNGKMTYLKATSEIRPDRWYHVAATYDGRMMRLFVNGKEEGSSAEQNGDILYPAANQGVIACYLDSNEKFPMDGVLLETKVLGRALGAPQITDEYTPGARRASFEPQHDATQRFVVRPYQQAVSKTGVTIMFETSRPCTATVEYGTSLPYAAKAESSQPSQFHEIALTGLETQTPYFYRVRCREEGGAELLGDDLTFQTAVHDDTPFSFAIIGDTQKNKPVIAQLQAFSFTLRPNFQIHLGDVVNTGADKAEWTEEMLDASWPMMSRVCMFPSLGNHEENHSNYYKYFSLPGPEYRYTYTYGNAQFWSIDTNKPVDPSSEQYKWIDETMAASKATWKFAYHHHPVYSSDENDYGDTYKGPSSYGDPRHRHLAALYEKHGVDIVFNGHIHSYERTWPIRDGKVDMERGVRYVVAGGGGGGLESASPTRPWFTQRVYRGHHVANVMISGRSLTMQAFDLEGRLFDVMEIAKPAPAAAR
jgi:hypothetical protein